MIKNRFGSLLTCAKKLISAPSSEKTMVERLLKELTLDPSQIELQVVGSSIDESESVIDEVFIKRE
jgi:hypothetical protein